MKILYIAGLFRKKSCSASIRNVALVNGFSQLGYEVTVLTVKFPKEVLDPYLISSVNSSVNIFEIESGIISSYIPSIYNGNGSPTKKSSYIKTFIKNLVYFPAVDKDWIKMICPQDYHGYDLVISSSDTKTSHFVADKIIQRNPMRWLQIWGDPWADDVGLSNYFLRLRASYSERKLLNKAHVIGYVSLPTANKVSCQLPHLKEKIKFVPRNFFKAIDCDKSDKNEFRIAYTGVLKGRDIKPILVAIKLYNNTHITKIHLDVFGRISPEQERKINESDCATFYGEVSLQKVYDIFKASDALLYLGNAAGSSQIPGKLYDYFGTNLPILALVQDMSDEVTKFILESNRCIVYENTIEHISFEKLIEKRNEFRIIEQYSPSAVASFIMKVMDA